MFYMVTVVCNGTINSFNMLIAPQTIVGVRIVDQTIVEEM